MLSLATNSRNSIIAVLTVLLLVIPTAVAEDASFNSTRKTSKDIAVNYELDSGIEWDASINQMEDGFKTNLDTWGPFIDDHDGKWVGGMSPEQLLSVNATGILNNITVGGLQSFTPHDVMGAGMSEGWVRSPIQQTENSEVGMDVYHVQNPQFAELVPGLGVPSVSSTAANWTSDYNATAMSHWEAGMGEFYENPCLDNYEVAPAYLLCFEEGAGTLAVDSSGNGYGPENLAGWWGGTWDWDDGANGGGVYTENGQIEVLPFPEATGEEDFSVSFWMKPTKCDSSQKGIARHITYWSAGWAMIQQNNVIMASFGSDLGTSFWGLASNDVCDGQWQHIVMSMDKSLTTAYMYQNGVLVDSRLDANFGGAMIPDVGAPLYIGYYSSDNYYGYLDEFAYSSVHYTQDMVSALYMKNRPVDGTFVLAPATDQAGSADWDFHDPNMMGWDLEDSTEGGSLGLAPKVWGNKETTAPKCPDHYEAINPNLVGLWCFDERIGDPKDTSGNGNDGTISGAIWTDGYLGSGLVFDGVNDYVSLDSAMPTDETSTLSLWVDTSTYGWDAFLGGTSNNRAYWYVSSTVVGIGHATGYTYLTVPVTSGWRHMAITHNSGTACIYINGVNTDCDTTGVLFGIEYIGADQPTNEYFDGSIDEVAIFDSVLSASQIVDLYELTAPDFTYADNLVGQWLLGEGSGSVAYDTSGNENHGAITDADYTGGYVGAGLHFDGSYDAVVIPDDDSLDILGSLTISAWVDITLGNELYQTVASKSDQCNNDKSTFQMRIDDNDRLEAVVGSDISNDRGNTVISLNEGWNQVALIFTPEAPVAGHTMVDFFIDGVLVFTDELWDSYSEYTNTADVVIGGLGDPSGSSCYYFDGFIDEFMMWDRALSSYEIYNLYLGSYDLHENEYYQSSYGSFAGIEDAYVNPTTVIALEAVYSDSISETYPGRAYMPDGLCFILD